MPLVEVENLSKKYLLEPRSGYTTLVETLSSIFRKKEKAQTFWALKDLSLKIEEGDRIGIVGRNGAGKSTFLKILSRITEPTTGRVKIRGRAASLLEVGTGFHPELTGRENIFLNGAILGMSRAEIRKKFDEIVAFSEIPLFLDTPVKRYSSGMKARLGFAVAAHLDPDLLIVDEVLGVGDIHFQEKCIKKLNTMGKEGRTVLFVSHNVGALLPLCNKGLYLEKGEMKHFGDLETCISHYVQANRQDTFSWEGKLGDEFLTFRRVALQAERPFFYQGELTELTLEYELLTPHRDLFLEVSVWNQREQLLARSITYERSFFEKPGSYKMTFPIDTALFHEGEYQIRINGHVHDVKPILKEEIALKLPVLAKEKNTRFQDIGKEGVFLGEGWKIEV